MKTPKTKKIPKILQNPQTRCILFLLLTITCIHIIAWNSKSFTNWYRLHIFPIWTNLLGRPFGLFHWSVGENLIIMGICLIIFEIVLFVFYIIKRRLPRRFSWNPYLICWVLVYIYGTETLNCYVLYHASTVEEQYFDTEAEYGTQELIDAYTEVVTKANELSEQVERSADGTAVYDGTYEELYTACAEAMQAQGEVYPYLEGFYPDPKPIRASHFMSQQYLLGIYFPFTMEANYNTVMYPVNVPAAVCHEYSHLKGIILEDEANYFGFVSCIEADDPYLQYSGYLSVLSYLARQVRRSVPQDMRQTLVNANEQVQKDDVFLTEDQWEQVEKKAVLSTETVNKATNAFLETNLTMNGVEDGIQSYSRVVRLVIRYYAGKNTKMHDKTDKT